MPTVLIVDRVSAVLRLAKTILENTGFKVLVATDAPKALKVLSDQTVHALLVDVALPNANTREFIREARKLYPGVPVCSMTADVAELHPVLQDVRLILKSFNQRDLIEMVRQTIDLYRRMQETKARWLATASNAWCKLP